MYIQKIEIEIKSAVDKDEVFQEINFLLEFYRANGQTQGKIESQYMSENKIVSLPFTLEKNSLDKNKNNIYVKNTIEKIEKLCNSKFKIKTLGKTTQNEIHVCSCSIPKFYVLVTNYISIDSPITCGSCNKSVPLYRLPEYYDFGYLPILSWESNYQACDRLQMNCEVGEKWSMNQMEKFDSQLSKQGISICQKIEKISNIPTYYYLYNYEKYKGDSLDRTCPSCHKRWNLKKKLFNMYDFKCDDCRLISNLSPYS